MKVPEERPNGVKPKRQWKFTAQETRSLRRPKIKLERALDKFFKAKR